MSPREFYNALEGWNEAEEWRQRREWERARYIAKASVSVHVAKKDQSKLNKAFSLPWDDELPVKKRRELTADELKAEEEKTIRIGEKLQKILG